MLTDSHDFPHQVSLEIKQDDKFFTRIMSKETSMANSSCRVYYGEASGAIPFIWESAPGTPKHRFSDTSIPPLTPPPSYYSTPKSKSKSMHKNLRSDLLTNSFPGFNPKKTHMSPSSSMSSTIASSSSLSSPTWSSFYSYPSAFINSRYQKGTCFSISRSPIPYTVQDDDDHHHGLRSPNSSMIYTVKRKGSNGFRGCYLMRKIKNALKSNVRHGSS